MEALNDEGKALKGSRVLILGLAYKANVDDDRESPSYKLIQKFEALGAKVEYHDPFVPVIPRTREHAEYAGRKSVPAITPDYDLIVLSTGHEAYQEFDFTKYPMPFVDTRNCARQRPAKYRKA
jgi:UDP-N-acetyl-D-glucosamine dehydrogenase